ncbi:TonB-dependent receptor [bacterium]|nr:TonB-dependent receptor [bacterium]
MKNWVRFTLAIMLVVLPMGLFAADGVIKGKVVNAGTGRPLAGANVILQGTTMGAASGRLGTFEITGVPTGNYTIKIMFMGYKNKEVQVTVAAGQAGDILVELETTTLMTEGTSIQGNLAVDRETPIAFTTLSGDELKGNYTTGDMPDLMKTVPGVFTTSAGLGEADLRIRGFDQDKVQIMINGIPVNDPESQQVYWSNWTGLSSTVKSMQIQRGAGSSLYGSGVFGGSVNIETMGVKPTSGITFRSSAGYFNTEGNTADGKIADGNGGFESYSPINYNVSLQYNSGLLYDGKLNYSVMFERKAGDSYVNGTYYDGYSFGLEVQSIFTDHKLLFSAIAAPQEHNQSRTMQDLRLIPTLGREYNRYNNEAQLNHYFKPQASLRHEWTISDKQFMSTNMFATMGRGGGQYLRNDSFDVITGSVGYKDASAYNDRKYFARHARYVYEQTGHAVTGYDAASNTFTYDGDTENPYKGSNLITSTYNHTWQNDSRNEHNQFGFNTYYQHQINEQAKLTVGGEFRYWHGFHYAVSEQFQKYNPTTAGVTLLDEAQRRYDYDTDVYNGTAFLRYMVKPVENLTTQIDLSYNMVRQVVVENAIEQYDFAGEKFTGVSFRNSRDSGKYTDADYERNYNFFSPKFGANYNINKNLNVLANVTIAKKEPRVGDWYDRSNGPGYRQPEGVKLNPEKNTNMEVGVGYADANVAVNVNYYHSTYDDKIESIYDSRDNGQTINAGKAVHQGVEVGVRGAYLGIDMSGSFTYAKNRWQNMNPNIETIFSADPEDVVGKVVPFAPEIMANAAIGYSLSNGIRVGLGFSWFDEYYATYTNDFRPLDENGDYMRDANGDYIYEDAKLPVFMDISFNVSVPFQVMGKRINVRLDLNNITNHDNFTRASLSKDYNRNDQYAGRSNWYVQQAPLFNAFVTTTIEL